MTPTRLARFTARRSLQALPVIAGVVTLTFALIHLAPGDPVYMMAGEGGDAAYYAEMRARYGLDRPLPAQFASYVAAVVRGDFGHSYEYQRPAMEVVLERAPATLLLSGAGLVLAILAGTALGALAAVAPGTPADTALRFAGSVVFAAPVFWLGQLLLLALAVAIPIFPVGGMTSLRETASSPVLDVLWHLALPAICLSAGFLAVLGRVLRSSVLTELRREYVRAACARGDSRTRAALAHALPNAAVPAITLIGHQAGTLLTGAGLAEVVFGWPGIGRLLLDASASRDYPLVIAVLIAVSVTVIAVNIVTDALYVVADPRIEV